MQRPASRVFAWSAVLAVVSCGGNQTEPKPPGATAPVRSTTELARPSPPVPTAAVQAPPPATATPTASPPPQHAQDLLLWIENVEGTTAATAGVMFAPAEEAVSRCVPTQPGVLQLRVARHADRTDVQVEPDKQVDPTVRQCVRDAVAATDFGAALAADGGRPSKIPSFACNVHISW